MEPVARRPLPEWTALLGRGERLHLSEAVSRETGEDESSAATRLWCAAECLKKAGLALDTPLTLASHSDDGWVVLGAGRSSIATLVTAVRGEGTRLALAFLAGGPHASL
jgi:enediyne polyketide synthase